MASRLGGSGLVAVSLLRGLRARKLRAGAGIVAGILGLAMTTALLVVTFSVLDAIRGVPLGSVSNAQWAVQARSSSGMSAERVAAIQRAVPGASAAPAQLVNTRMSAPAEQPILVVGATPELRGMLDPSLAEQFAGRPLSGRELLLTRSWAEDHGVKAGETVSIESPSGVQTWRVRGLVSESFANGGAVAIGALPEVAAAFDRRGVADVVFVRGDEPAGALRERLRRAAAGAADVVAPSDTAKSYERSFQSVRSLLNLFVLMGLLTAGAVVYFCWRLTIEDERDNVARLRLVGARRRHLAIGSGMVLLPGLAISLLVGGPLGLLIGSGLSEFARDLVRLTQLAASPEVPIGRPLAGAAAAGVVIFAAAWYTAVRTFSRVSVIEAVAQRGDAAGPRGVRGVAVAFVVAVAAGVAAVALLPTPWRALAFFPLVAALLLGALVVPSVAGALVRRQGGFVALGAGRELAYSGRRNAALLAVFALAIAMSLALEGTAASLQREMAASVRAWTQADLFVQTSESGANLQDDKFTPAGQRAVATTPGVRSTSWFDYTTVVLGGRRIQLWAWQAADIEDFVRLKIEEGPSGAEFWRALERGQLGVSTNYAELHDVDVGDSVSIPTATGSQRMRVAAVVRDFVADGGALFLSEAMYRRVTGNDRRYQLLVRLDRGADPPAVSAAIRDRLAQRHPGLVVWDQPKIREHFKGLTDQLLVSFRLFSRLMFVLSLLIGGASIASSMAVRRRALAVARLVGASAREVRRQTLREHLVLGVCAWLVGLPVGLLLVKVLIDGASIQSGLLPTVRLPIALAVVALPLAVALSVLSLLLAWRERDQPPLASALAEE